jgi:Fuc2NAc and GlcNAc transferase
LGNISLRFSVFVGMSSLVVAVAGFLDDRHDVRVSMRLALHVVAAFIFLGFFSSDTSITFGNQIIDNRSVLFAVAALYLIWMLNLFNFMDGIDGIAGIEAITTAVGAGVLLFAAGHRDISFVCFLLAASCAGFLAWNWPPAKIFMGDVGSGFLGFTLAAISIVAHVSGALEIWAWLILMSVFIVDATVTLFTRMIRGDRWLRAHRSHGYQKASRHFGSHVAVTLTVLLINMFWLFPLAFSAAKTPENGWWLTTLAWAPLIAIALLIGSGRPD